MRKKKNGKSREQVCAIFWRQQLANEASRTSRDGISFKTQWLTRNQTAWLTKVKSENGESFVSHACGKKWSSSFIHAEKIVLVSVTVARNGASLMRVSEYAAPEFERCSRLVKALQTESFHEMRLTIALTALSDSEMKALEAAVKQVRMLCKEARR